MQLQEFIKTLTTQGVADVADELTPFTEDDINRTTQLLETLHHEQKLIMPAIFPDFDANAAGWSAIYIYRSVQCTFLRHIENEEINELLQSYTQNLTPSAIASAHLCLRHLKRIKELAAGLSPEDILVVRLRETARKWPFSGVGIPEVPDENALQMIFSNESLTLAYIDNIIHKKEIKLAMHPVIREKVADALGNHSATLWPEFESALKV